MGKVKLFFFPYAGGSSKEYLQWRSLLEPSIDLYPIDPPGRGSRLNETLLSSFDELLEDVYVQIKPEVESIGDYAFFGHSMGNLIAVELAYNMMNLQENAPTVLFLSGRNPPCTEHKHNHHQLEDHELKKAVLEMGGLPDILKQNSRLLELFLPQIRNDFKLVENHTPNLIDQQLNSEIEILDGNQDKMTDFEALEKWRGYTSKECTLHHFSGGHFFIHHNEKDIAHLINRKLHSYIY